MAYDFPSSPSTGDVYQPSGGPSWQWDGTAWKSFQVSGEMAINLIAIPGPNASYVYSKPSNLRYLEVEGCGGGGSGSAAIATAASTYSFGASGGGGAWGKKLFAAGALPASVTIAVGAGGASASAAGVTGGATTFGSLITLPGGIGGPQGANTTTTGVIGPTTTTANPTGVDFGSSGSLGGMTGALPSAWNHIGPGGSTPYGAGSPFLLGSSGQVGGTGYGSGSSGCYNPPSNALKASVAAQPGIMILTEYLAVAPAVALVPGTADSYNRIVNGAMQISQENGDTPNGFGTNYPADQWYATFTTATSSCASGRYAITTPRGSKYRIRAWCAVLKASLAASDYFAFIHRLEGAMIADLLWGTANAKQVVLRFGFKGPAGTYSVSMRNWTAGNGTHNYTTTFNISAGEANTDIERTIVIPGATVATWSNDNTLGIDMWFVLAAGSSYLNTTPNAWAAYTNGLGLAVSAQKNGMDSISNVFELFDVGLYKDPGNTGVAPPWEFPDEASELARCQRYWQQCQAHHSGAYTNGVTFYATGNMVVTPRTTPILTGTNGGNSGVGAAVGTLNYLGAGLCRDGRIATSTTSGGLWWTLCNCNARM